MKCIRCNDEFDGNKLFRNTDFYDICSDCLTNDEKSKMLEKLEGQLAGKQTFQISVYIRYDQLQKLEEEKNKSKAVREALDAYYKSIRDFSTKAYKIVELNGKGINVEETDNPMATRFFDDNGGLPDGNFKDNIAGKWLIIHGKIDVSDKLEYAYRTIDNTTLIKID